MIRDHEVSQLATADPTICARQSPSDKPVSTAYGVSHFDCFGYSMKFPNWWDAPGELLAMEGHCGLLAAWMVLRHFAKRVSIPKLAKACGYTKRHGVFAVGLAAGLKVHGLQVSFHSEPDNHIDAFERRCYDHARRVGVVAQPALELASLLRERKRGRIPIVFYNMPSDVGHFSPLLGARGGMLRLPLADDGVMSETDFLAKWSEPYIFRQSVVAGL